MPQNKRSQSAIALEQLGTGAMTVLGRMPYSSNATFLVEVAGEPPLKAIYKPGRGERSLWDFPDCLFKREVAAYELANALGWGIVPPTILRKDGPLGEGSLQLFIDADFHQHYFTLFERPELHPQLKRFALFDIIANNADRKSGHILIDDTGDIWGIDHGVCFHPDPKLRTVIWEFAGTEIPPELLDDLAGRSRACLRALEGLLDEQETRALEKRIDEVLKDRRFPIPNPDMRCYPWPLI